jgi:hypothetical protein
MDLVAYFAYGTTQKGFAHQSPVRGTCWANPSSGEPLKDWSR